MSSIISKEEVFQESTGLEHITRYFEDREQDIAYVDAGQRLTEVERIAYGDMNVPIKIGAWVISVDGETDDKKGTLKYEKKAVIGRYVALKPLNPYYIRIMFTTPDGLYYRGTKNLMQKPIISPLAKQPFVVPVKGGMRLLDNGNILLVSRTGLFNQIEGYELSQQYLKELAQERQRSDNFMVKYQETLARIETTQEHSYHTEEMLMEARETLRIIQTQVASVSHAKGKVEGILKNLEARVSFSEDNLEHARMQLKDETSSIARLVSDLDTMLEVARIDESMKSLMSEHPAVTRKYEQRVMDKWRREGIMKDNEYNILKRRLDETQQELKKQEEREFDEGIGGHTPESPDGDEEPDFGTGGTDSTEEVEQDVTEVERTTRGGKFSEKLSNVKDKTKQSVSKAYETGKSLIKGKGETTEEPDEEGESEEEPAGDEDSE